VGDETQTRLAYTAWRNASFSRYAHWMETKEFRKGIERLPILQQSGTGGDYVPGKQFGGAVIAR